MILCMEIGKKKKGMYQLFWQNEIDWVSNEIKFKLVKFK